MVVASVDERLAALVRNIWTTMLGLDLVVSGGALEVRSEQLQGCVHISGSWEGALTIACPTPLARRAAAIMFGMTDEELGVSEVRDALGELTNMVGGNFKSLLDPPCRLSLPVVVQGVDVQLCVPGTRVLTQVSFHLESEPLVVAILQRTEPRTERNV